MLGHRAEITFLPTESAVYEGLSAHAEVLLTPKTEEKIPIAAANGAAIYKRWDTGNVELPSSAAPQHADVSREGEKELNGAGGRQWGHGVHWGSVANAAAPGPAASEKRRRCWRMRRGHRTRRRDAASVGAHASGKMRQSKDDDIRIAIGLGQSAGDACLDVAWIASGAEAR
ncbi:hypothetical protein AXG93_1793s1410 [Marchantia polymorpha subsp. ruderalis]|uniref:Uncharacterized protein n=1 Tax=Marchantia polymorpha subsp. ruderalis TaxID=1480154 RepID=A0A176WGF3_MARPO|nr:hypothetical protein AXG93_1793s1410 [Marchantia polymorpha subsp. ruderalis]